MATRKQDEWKMKRLRFDRQTAICYSRERKRGVQMEQHFEFLDMNFFTRASVFPGSLGTFRYRFKRTGWLNKPDSEIQVWVYENTSFELAQEIETETFPWTEEGVEQIKAWLEQKLKERGTEPYRIPYPAKKKDVLEQSE